MNGRIAAGATIALVGGLGVAAVLLVQPALDWPSDQSRPLAGRAVVELSGRVTNVEPRAGAVWIAPTALGFNARRLLIDGATRILVGDKEGGLGDVAVGARVAAICEPGDGAPVARWIGVNLDAETLRVAALRADTPAPQPPAPAERVSKVPPPPVLAAPPAAPPAAPSRPAAPRALAPSRAQPAAPRALPPPRAQLPDREPAARPGAPTSDDPGAVIDWLLRQSGRN
jgi:hypothetical protein